MKIAIFSDIHIAKNNPEVKKLFCDTLLSLKTQKVTHLWLLGDIFDVFFGNFLYWRKIYGEVFACLRDLKNSGINIQWIEGNHDFSMKEIVESYGCQTSNTEKKLLLAGSQNLEKLSVYLAHGDLINPEDKLHKKWRDFSNSAVFKNIIKYTPEKLAEHSYIASAFKVSALSRSLNRANHETAKKIKERYRELADIKFKEGYNAVFMGHCHVHDLYQACEKSFYLNLGSWKEEKFDSKKRYGLWEPQKKFLPDVIEVL